MQINLMNGSFNKMEALDLITQIVSTKINFHVSQIGDKLEEDDIKRREQRIRQLQNELQAVREEILKSDGRVNLNCQILVG